MQAISTSEPVEPTMKTGHCLVCDTPTSRSCSSCQSVFYCTEEHEKNDSPSHEEYCLKIKSAPNTFTALLFGVNSTKPRLIKVPFELKGTQEQYHKLDHSIWFKQPFSSVRPLFFHRYGMNGPRLPHPLCVIYDDNYSMNGSEVNACVEAVTSPRGGAGHWWRGNVLALRMGKGYDFMESVDEEEDLGALVRFFEEYGRVTPED